MTNQQITLVVACANNGCIGINNTIPWHISEDFKFFKQYTLDKPIIMGRKTWQSLPQKPLPQRRNIVISRQADDQTQADYQAQGAEIVSSLEQALELCADTTEVCIIGGAQIYTLAMDIATDLRVTEIDLEVDGDAFFPNIEPTIWQEKSRLPQVSSKNQKFDFVHYQRK